MEANSGEFQDWEMLHNTNSDDGFALSSTSDDDDDELTTTPFDDIEVESEGVIRSDYFSLDSDKRYGRTAEAADDETDCNDDKGSVGSDNPSWVDPGSDPRYGVDGSSEVGFQGIAFRRKNSSEFWSDSSSDGQVSRKLGDSDRESELGFVDEGRRELVLEGIGENDVGGVDTGSGGLWLDSGGEREVVAVKEEDVEGEGSVGLDDTSSATGGGLVLSPEMEVGDGFDAGIVVEGGGGLDSTDLVECGGTETTDGIGTTEMNGSFVAEPVNSSGRDCPPSGEKRGIVWWKLPLELLKFCVFRVSPVWSVSIAAAVMGFVIMRRRLHKMKQKSQSLALKVTIEDKKVSQFMTRAARLNEAFSVVRRVPIVRPSLPTGGVTPWPVMTLR